MSQPKVIQVLMASGRHPVPEPKLNLLAFFILKIFIVFCPYQALTVLQVDKLIQKNRLSLNTRNDLRQFQSESSDAYVAE